MVPLRLCWNHCLCQTCQPSWCTSKRHTFTQASGKSFLGRFGGGRAGAGARAAGGGSCPEQNEPWQKVPRRRRLRKKQPPPAVWETLPLSSAFLALVENVDESGGEEVSAPSTRQAAVDPDSVAVDVPTQTVLASVGEERAKWWQAGEAQLHDIQSHLTYVPIDAQEMRRLKAEGAEVLPAKAVWTLKPSVSPGGPKKHKLRIAVCGNFSEIWDAVYCNTLDAELHALSCVKLLVAGGQWASLT